MLLQNSGSKQSPSSPAALKACSPPPAQYQAAAYKNLWRLRAAISINVVFSYVIETQWIQIPNFHFFHLGSKAKYCYWKYKDSVGIKPKLMFSIVPPHANTPACKMCFYLLCKHFRFVKRKEMEIVSSAWQSSTEIGIPQVSVRYMINFFPQTWGDMTLSYFTGVIL